MAQAIIPISNQDETNYSSVRHGKTTTHRCRTGETRTGGGATGHDRAGIAGGASRPVAGRSRHDVDANGSVARSGPRDGRALAGALPPHGAHATIPLHWDERAQTLTIGERHGTFPGMLEKRTFHLTWVRPGHGVGETVDVAPDLVVSYSGQALSVPRPKD